MKNFDTIRIATRASRLAMWQADHIASLLQEKGYQTELVVMTTKGDIVQDRFLHEIGGKGLFIKELEKAMLEDRADIAVHSLKDMPVCIPRPLTLGAICKRHSPRDLLIFNPEYAAKQRLPVGSISPEDLRTLGSFSLGTASLRRKSLLKSITDQINCEKLRGNVDRQNSNGRNR